VTFPRTDKWSQFGEDGIIEAIFDRIGTRSAFCVEFGAADGLTCSNTKALREVGWSALLIESDPALAARAEEHAGQAVEVLNETVTADNLDGFIDGRQVDFMSIDVDGTDYQIWAGLEARPRVVCIEYNASIPPSISIRQGDDRSRLGASALALHELGLEKGYHLVDVTKGNLIFVHGDGVVRLHTDTPVNNLDRMHDPAWLTYLATDYDGRYLTVGAEPPWGYIDIPHVGPTIGDAPVLPVGGTAKMITGVEAEYGNALALPQGVAVEDATPEWEMCVRWLLTRVHPRPVVFDIADLALTARFDWLQATAARLEYDMTVTPASLIALTPRRTR
jgi:hypothetical protein